MERRQASIQGEPQNEIKHLHSLRKLTDSWGSGCIAVSVQSKSEVRSKRGRTGMGWGRRQGKEEREEGREGERWEGTLTNYNSYSSNENVFKELKRYCLNE